MTKKFLMYQLSAAQAQVAMLQELIAQEDKATPEVQNTGAQQKAPEEKAPVKAKDAPQTKAKPAVKAKAQPVQEEVEESEETASEVDDMFGDDSEVDDTPTVEDVRKAVKAFATKHGKDKAIKLLGKFKVTSIPDLKKQDFAKVIELAQKHT